MPVLQNIKDKIKEMFGNNMNSDKINLYVNTIVLEFSDDFPEFRSYFINNIDNEGYGNLRLKFNDVDKNIIKPIGYIRGSKDLHKMLSLYPSILEYNRLNEIITMTLYSRLSLFSISNRNLIQPILDSTD